MIICMWDCRKVTWLWVWSDHCYVPIFNLCSFTYPYLYWSLLAKVKTQQNKAKDQKKTEFSFVRSFVWSGKETEYRGSGSIMSTIWVRANVPAESEFHLKVFEVPRNQGQQACRRTEISEGKYSLTGIISKIKQTNLHQIKLLLLHLNLRF